MPLPHVNYILKESRLYIAVLLILASLFLLKNAIFPPGPKANFGKETKLFVSKWAESPLWAEDQRPQVSPHKYRYLRNEAETCDRPQVDLLILVASKVDHFDQREAIRSSWGQGHELEKYNAKLLFLLGQGHEEQSLVNQESGLTHDIVQEDFQVSHLIRCSIS